MAPTLQSVNFLYSRTPCGLPHKEDGHVNDCDPTMRPTKSPINQSQEHAPNKAPWGCLPKKACELCGNGQVEFSEDPSALSLVRVPVVGASAPIAGG